ncbi:MAG: imidazole glycerol phosphate synthase subunit HisH [Chloroflexus sp.]|uniref:imidazole glycerol phosphate synthase subunit HisH n=1 Tax=Chloroflexus sp. TaxID=1904827 RepID=UPI0021DF2EE9|nr:imidazole glycerol phosphate synthase subunit HisH [Chloroflexus sp.]GIV89917.1 MAG: imidazole glycerol phosphate synthase subunit HisH [Chloroflexus sp.]
MIAVINYGAGNLPNVVRALQRVGAKLTITDDPHVIRSAHAVVLPGVGATADTMASLRQLGIADVLPEVIAAGTPFLGICVGMQVLLSASEEFGPHPCLDIVRGTVRRLPDSAGKIPQIGWNQLRIMPNFSDHPLFVGIPNGADVYFVHSYYCDVTEETIVAARTEYGIAFPSVIIRNRLAAVQFHPEKSGDYGLRLLANFVTWSNASPARG